MIKISARARDVLLDQIVDHIHGIDDLRIVVERRDFASAERLARDYSDDLRLATEVLGWGEARADEFELTLPPGVLRRLMSRYCQAALQQEVTGLPERLDTRRELQEATERNQAVIGVCQRVLAELDQRDARSPASNR